MAKAKKAITPKPKKKGKYDITVKTDLTADQLLKLAINTPIRKRKRVD
ncbi:MAG: hypothetical protein ABI675_26740 [Chitinophagaceae bacterium]